MPTKRENSGPGVPGLARPELFLTVFMTGAAVMLIEILGTRIIGPVFGVSLFVWSALLAVTLGSLAIGYYGGGVLADRAPDPRLLGLVVTLSGVLLGLVHCATRCFAWPRASARAQVHSSARRSFLPPVSSCSERSYRSASGSPPATCAPLDTAWDRSMPSPPRVVSRER